MQLEVTVRHGTVAPAVREYVEKRLRKLERRLPPDALVECLLARDGKPSSSDDHVVEVIVHLKGTKVVAKQPAETFEKAADVVLGKLERQIERVRDLRVQEPRRRAG